MDYPTRAAKAGARRKPAAPETYVAPGTTVPAADRAKPEGGKALARIRYFARQRGLELPSTAGPEVRLGRNPFAPARASEERGAKAPPRGFRAVAKAKEALTPSFAASVNLPLWRPLGPFSIPKGQSYGTGSGNRPPVSGRVNGLVADAGQAGRLVLSSAGGGLWESTDAGKSWRPLTDDQPVLSMGAICAAPSSPNIVYAGTGEGDGRLGIGVGLLRSSDAGRSWTLAPAAVLDRMNFYDIAVDPNDPLHVLVGTTGFLAESRDGGQSWQRRINAVTWDISFHPQAPSEALAATGTGLMQSADGGKTWVPVALPNPPDVWTRIEVCHAPSDGGVAYVFAAGFQGGAARGYMWRRGAAGSIFAAVNVPNGLQLTQAWYDWCGGVAPDNPNLVYWGIVHLRRGTRKPNGSFTWENISSRPSGMSIHPDQHHVAFDPHDPKVVYSCNDGGLYRSADRGTKWESLNTGLCVTEFEFLSHLDRESTFLIGGTQDNGTLSMSSGGTWNQTALGDGGDCAFDNLSSGSMYHSYYYFDIERATATNNASPSWRGVLGQANPELYAVQFYPPLDVVGRTLATAGESLLISTDSGNSWKETPLPVDRSVAPRNRDRATAVTILDANRIAVGSWQGAVWMASKSGASWANATIRTLAPPRAGFAFISDVFSDAVVPGRLWLTCSAFGGGHVFRSDDGGASWQDVSTTLPDIPVHALVQDPDNPASLYAATDSGVYRSVDGGAAWATFSNGLPNVIVGDLIFHARDRLLRAGTRSRGAWEVKI